MVRSWCLPVALVWAACASSTWKEVRGGHVLLRTDMDDADAVQGVELLDRLRASAVAALWPGVPGADAIELQVVSLASGLDFDTLYGPDSMGYGRAASFTEAPTRLIVLWGTPGNWSIGDGDVPNGRSFAVLKGMVWQLGRQIEPSAPPWYLLGLGENLVPLASTNDGELTGFGAVNWSALERYRKTRLFTVGELMAWDGRATTSGACGFPALEGGAWASVNWMIKVRPEAFTAFRAALRQGVPTAQAWRTAFPDLSLDELGTLVHAYLRKPNQRIWWMAAPPVAQAPPSFRSLSSTEVEALLAELKATAPDSIATVR